jgi:glutamate mutase epsilon subunit
MNSTSLIQLIKESIQEYIREVETSGNIAAQEAKIKACEEAIALREKKANMDGLDEAYHDMMDSTKINELKKEIKELQKYKTKAEKVLEKMKSKAEGKTAKKDEETTEEGIIDEVSIEENDPESGPQLEEENIDIYEMLYMQKRAGILSEREYNEKIEEAKKMTAAQKEKKEDIVKGMKKSKSFGKSKDEKAKMYATATKLAKK